VVRLKGNHALTVAALLMISVLAAGCTENPALTEATTSPPATTTTAPEGNNTQPDAAPQANLTASVVNGTAPLTVTFTITDDADTGADVTWALDLGDGETVEGDAVPAEVNYTYGQAGTYAVILALLVDNETVSSDQVNVTVAAGASTTPPPSKTVYQSGPLVGCVTELGHANCPAVVLGTSDTRFGLWIQLEPGHVGMNFTAKSLSGDSDGWLFADPKAAPLSDVHNGGGEAKGRIPPAAKWLLVVPWAAPSDKVVVTFTP
jgi:hypothetical protein